jgi:hypothetical protein
VILTAKARIAVARYDRSVEAMTQGRARDTQGRENGHDHIARHRPRGAAARRRRILLQTQGLSRTGGSLARIVRFLTQYTAPTGCRRAGKIGDAEHLAIQVLGDQLR